MAPGLLDSMDHVKLLPFTKYHTPAIAPIVRFSRPAARDIINVTLSPSSLLPIEREYRRSSVLFPTHASIEKDTSEHRESDTSTSTSEQYAMMLPTAEEDTQVDSAQDRVLDTTSKTDSETQVELQSIFAYDNGYGIKRPSIGTHSRHFSLPAITIIEESPTTTSTISLPTTTTQMRCSSESLSQKSSATVIVRKQLRRRSELLFTSTRGLLKDQRQSDSDSSSSYGPYISQSPKTQRQSEQRIYLDPPNTIGDVLLEPILTTVGKVNKVSPTANSRVIFNSGTQAASSSTENESSAFVPTLAFAFVSSHHGTIFYGDAGDPEGQTVLLIPGPAYTRFLAGFLHDIAKNLHQRIIVVERPGQGASPVTAQGVYDFPAVVLEICNRLQITKYSILAHSLGAAYALQLAEAHASSTIVSVILLAPKLSQKFMIGSMESLAVKPVEKYKSRSCLSCVSPHHLCQAEASRTAHELSKSEKMLWKMSTSPINLRHDQLHFESARLAGPLTKLPGKFTIIHLKGDHKSTIEHNKCLQTWLHDCQLFEWDDLGGINYGNVWLMKNLMTDLLTLLASEG